MGKKKGGSNRLGSQSDVQRYLRNERQRTRGSARADDRRDRGNPRTSPNFGSGEVGGDNRWTPPVHGTTADGQDVTVSFGQVGREGHTGIASGHVSGTEYFPDKGEEPGHDQYGPSGESHRDSGRYRE